MSIAATPRWRVLKLRCLFPAPRGHGKIARGFQPLGAECERVPGAGSPWLLTIAPVGARKPRNIKICAYRSTKPGVIPAAIRAGLLIPWPIIHASAEAIRSRPSSPPTSPPSWRRAAAA